MSFLVNKDKNLALNPDQVSVARLNDDDSLLISLGQNAVTVPAGEDADALMSHFGLAKAEPAKSGDSSKSDAAKSAAGAHAYQKK
jgi:hypothetical protein